MRRLPVLLLAYGSIALAATGVGCGAGGVAGGATVSVSVVEPLCHSAERELRREGKQVGEVQVSITCLPPVQRHGRLDLATVGSNARRATADSTAVAYLEKPSPANGFSEPILKSASVGWLYASSGTEAMRHVLRAIRAADRSTLRESVRDSLTG